MTLSSILQADSLKGLISTNELRSRTKFRINDPTDVVALLAGLEATAGEIEQHRDTYFNHPARDFAETDEAFRIRSIGDDNRLTYKGPLVDRQTRRRSRSAARRGWRVARIFAR